MTGFQYLFGAFCLAGLLVVSGVWVFQTHGVYRFDRSPQSPQDFGLNGVRVLSFASEDGAPVQAWLSMPKPGRPILFSFYGNFAAIGPSLQRLAPLTGDGSGIVMLQYRGAGGAPGHPSEENFARDARALYDQLDTLAGQTIPPERRVLHGFSLGSGVAVRLASERAFAGIVLEAAIPRLCLYFQRRYHGLPLCLLMWAERYDSSRRINRVAAPLLFVHGKSDLAVPISWARQLYDGASPPKKFIEVTGAGHTDLAQHGLIGILQDFLRKRAE
jgi:fermentation-respiration switch protein FrsA (DUF1100 family)